MNIRIETRTPTQRRDNKARETLKREWKRRVTAAPQLYDPVALLTAGWSSWASWASVNRSRLNRLTP